jgi:hypothetical protein
VGQSGREIPDAKTVYTVLRLRGAPAMPRRVNSNPRYSRHRAAGQAIVTIEGNDIYLGLWNSAASKAEYAIASSASSSPTAAAVLPKWEAATLALDQFAAGVSFAIDRLRERAALASE